MHSDPEGQKWSPFDNAALFVGLLPYLTRCRYSEDSVHVVVFVKMGSDPEGQQQSPVVTRKPGCSYSEDSLKYVVIPRDNCSLRL